MTPVNLSSEEMRWRDYVLIRGRAFSDFWLEHESETGRQMLFILGRGFDPRATLGLARIIEVANNCQIDVIGLDFIEESALNIERHRVAADDNWKRVGSILSNRGSLRSQGVRFRSKDGRRIAARSAANIFMDASDLDRYTDVIADISAMPRVVYFPLLSRLIFFHDERLRTRETPPNIHVVVSEDPNLDTVIRELGIDETASFLHPFEGPFNQEAKGGTPVVWIPVLGENRDTQIDRIYDLVKPDEVCPVLPSPARNPRRCDSIVMEYHSLLFDELLVEPRDIIYASESNPFDVYRQVRRAALHYDKVLNLIGGCRVALSALCSKVMSLGVLLVAYELKTGSVQLGIAHIECESYELPANTNVDVEQVGIWVAGECYRKE